MYFILINGSCTLQRLVLRLLPLLSNPAPLVHKLLLDLVPIARKDGVEQLLLTFLPAIRTYLSTVVLSTLVEVSKQYETNFMLSTKVSCIMLGMFIYNNLQLQNYVNSNFNSFSISLIGK